MLTLSGVISGAIIGTGISMYIEAYPLNLLSDAYYDPNVPARVEWFLVLVVMVVATLVGFFGSWFPARKIANEPIGKI